MEALFNLCIIKPNQNAFSETFVQEHIDKLPGNKTVLYGGAFPVYDHEGKYLIKSTLGLLSYLIQKRLLKKQDIKIRTNALVKYFKDQKIDIVFAEYGMVGAMITEACKLANVPLIIHFHGADVHHRETVNQYSKLYKKAFAYANALIAVSGDMVEALKKLGASPDKIILASCGVDTEAFPQLDILNSGRNFLSIGRFVEKKSPTSIVNAFKIVAARFPDARLVLIGNGPLFKETERLINELHLQDKIQLTGILKSDEIKQFMKQSRCFVQHSVTAKNGDKEGTPVTILEAGSSGLAIVSTQHAGIKEAVINGETGYLVPEHDIEGMANYMIKIALDVQLAAELGRKEAIHIRKNFDTRDRINTLSTLIYKALKSNQHV